MNMRPRMRLKRNTLQHVSKWVYGDEAFWGAALIDSRFAWSTGVLMKWNPCFPNQLENVSNGHIHVYTVSSIIKYILVGSKFIYRVHRSENTFLMKAGAYHKRVVIGLSPIRSCIHEISMEMGSLSYVLWVIWAQDRRTWNKHRI